MAETTPKTQYHTEIPPDLKTLVSCVSRGFYPYEHAIVMDYLIYYPCLKEDDIVDLLKFDRKQLRAIMASLKNDKLVKTKIRLETSADGKSQRHNYYFINYQVLVNVIKYKLDHMRRKIESEDLVTTNRASFVCPTCVKTFTDLEVDQLFDPMSGCLRCSYCGSEVEEEGSDRKKDSRSTLVKFNEQFRRLFELLSKVENVKLSPELLDPDPTILNSTRSQSGRTKIRDPDGAWSGDATRSAGIDYKSTVTINYDDEKEKDQERKERLAWMEESTVEGSMAESIWKEDEDSDKVSAKPDTSNNKSRSQDIFNTLLAHEKKGPTFTPVAGLKAPDEEDNSDSDSDDEMGAGPSKGSSKKSKPVSTTLDIADNDDDNDSNDDDGERFFVSVGGEQIALDDVDDDVISRMTQSEKDAWIQLTQRIYADHYD